MQVFMNKPSIDLYPGIRVSKDTVLEYKTETVDQKLENLVFRSAATVKGKNFESTYEATIHLEEGDILVFEEAGRGYIKPVEELVTIPEAIEELNCIKDLG